MGYQDRLEDGSLSKVVQVFRNGRSRAIRIPKEFEFEAESAVLRRQPDGSILMSPAVTAGLLDYLQEAEAWTGGSFLAGDDDLAALDEVKL